MVMCIIQILHKYTLIFSQIGHKMEKKTEISYIVWVCRQSPNVCKIKAKYPGVYMFSNGSLVFGICV